MINELKREILELEDALKLKISQLEKLINFEDKEKVYKKDDKLIAIVEMYESFYWIEDVRLINDTPEGIREVKDKYNEFMYQAEFKIYRIEEYQKNFKNLEDVMMLGNEGEIIIQDWMRKNKNHLIDI